MPRPAKTQWDFGDLFSAERTRKVLSVSELTRQIKRLLEDQVGQVWVSGEITNLRAKLGPYLFHAQGCGRAVELRLISR